jgi:hypothetical protein
MSLLRSLSFLSRLTYKYAVPDGTPSGAFAWSRPFFTDFQIAPLNYTTDFSLLAKLPRPP